MSLSYTIYDNFWLLNLHNVNALPNLRNWTFKPPCDTNWEIWVVARLIHTNLRGERGERIRWVNNIDIWCWSKTTPFQSLLSSLSQNRILSEKQNSWPQGLSIPPIQWTIWCILRFGDSDMISERRVNSMAQEVHGSYSLMHKSRNPQKPFSRT